MGIKHIFFSLGLITLALDCIGDSPLDTGADPEITRAKTAIKQVAGALQSELKVAMQAGGPVAAIAVCNTRAMPITEQLAAEHGLQVSRVSLKNRNPGNAPNEWQTDVLENFNRQRSAGVDITKLTWSETVDLDGSREFRFMKAIPTGEVCLKCHGKALSPQISTVLADLYPLDQATGFSIGDIRGAFVVTRNSRPE